MLLKAADLSVYMDAISPPPFLIIGYRNGQTGLKIWGYLCIILFML
jgi:hypothetical protein